MAAIGDRGLEQPLPKGGERGEIEKPLVTQLDEQIDRPPGPPVAVEGQ